MRLADEIHELALEQLDEFEQEKPAKRKPSARNKGQKPAPFRFAKPKPSTPQPRPAWMSDASLLPKRPPTRTP